MKSAMKKLRSRAGTTLVETLLAVAMLGILAAASAVASGVVISTRQGMVHAANAETLGSTVLEALSDEVRYGREVEVITDSELKLDSPTLGPGVTLGLDGGHIVATPPSTTAGDLAELLPEKAYTGLMIKELKFEKATTGDQIKISVAVADSTDNTIWSGDCTVKPLNPLAITAP